MGRRWGAGTAAAALGLALAAGAGAQPAPAGEQRRVVVGEQFRRGGLYRLLFGSNYRDLWTTPVELPVLDLATFAGGLTPTRRLGHGQTRALGFKGADGVVVRLDLGTAQDNQGGTDQQPPGAGPHAVRACEIA